MWVRGEVDSRSKILAIEDVKPEQACRACCLNDCTDPENTKSREKRAKTKGKEIFVPRDEVVAPKEFKEEILFGKTRSQRTIKPEMQLAPAKVEMRKDTLLNDLSQLFFALDDENANSTNEPLVETLADDFKQQTCHECSAVIKSDEELRNHFTAAPLKHYRGSQMFAKGFHIQNKLRTAGFEMLGIVIGQ